jgi:hypothetical protein
MYIASDEVELALRLLDSPPAYYRDHVPERAKEIRRSLNRQLFTPVQYAGIDYGPELTPEQALASFSHRFEALDKVVWQYNNPAATRNADGTILQLDINIEPAFPHVMELAPGAMIARDGMRARGRKFSYEHTGLADEDKEAPMWGNDPDEPAIFVAFELGQYPSDLSRSEGVVCHTFRLFDSKQPPALALDP